MKNPRLANRYAKALFDFADEKEQIEAVHRDLINIRASMKTDHELQTVLNSPVIPPAKKHVIFANIFKGRVHEITFNFLDILIRKKREPALDSICDSFLQYYNERHQIKVATLTTAQPISGELVVKIKQMLEEKTKFSIEIQQDVDPEIIGGIIVKMDDYYYDASVSSKINKLKQEFAHNIYQVNF